MVKREEINGVPVVVEVRPVGGLGWTWSYYPDSGAGANNLGRLLASEEEAFAAARAAAAATLNREHS